MPDVIGELMGIYAQKVGNSSRIPALPPQEEAAAEKSGKDLTTRYVTIMQEEDDLRGGRNREFRIHGRSAFCFSPFTFYWFCYEWFAQTG